MLDKDGFRANVGMVISDGRGRVLLAKRLGQDAWQFPQGGVDKGESAEQALFRELYEEVGLTSSDVRIVQRTKKWLRYRIPPAMQRKRSKPLCIGQKQKWFFLEFNKISGFSSFNKINSPLDVFLFSASIINVSLSSQKGSA